MSPEAAYVTSTGRVFKRSPGGQRKIPRETRAHLYQLHLTVLECKAEIREILRGHGIDVSNTQTYQMRRIVEDRGA